MFGQTSMDYKMYVEDYTRRHGRRPPKISDLIPYTLLAQWELLCLDVADGNAERAEHLFDEAPLSEVYRWYALKLANTYQPYHRPK